jgi:glycosyltransferase involved in cell wall biosynthesis
VNKKIKDMKKCSVIMAVYNTKEFLVESIESILYQDFFDFEFIIIDDASTDGSEKVIEQYAERDARIRYTRNEKNM